MFDAANDPLETNDLVAKNAEVADALAAKWLGWWCQQSGEETYRLELNATRSEGAVLHAPYEKQMI